MQDLPYGFLQAISRKITKNIKASSERKQKCFLRKTLSLHWTCSRRHISLCIRVYLDCSLKRFATVFPACGSFNPVIKLTCEERKTISRGVTWVNVLNLKISRRNLQNNQCIFCGGIHNVFSRHRIFRIVLLNFYSLRPALCHKLFNFCS